MSRKSAPRIKDWRPVVYTLSEAESRVFCGKLRHEGVPAVVFHSSIWTGVYGLSFSDDWVVLAPKTRQKEALKALDLRQPLSAFDRKQLLGRRYDFWLSQGLGFYGWPIILLRMLWSRLRRAGEISQEPQRLTCAPWSCFLPERLFNGIIDMSLCPARPLEERGPIRAVGRMV